MGLSHNLLHMRTSSQEEEEGGGGGWRQDDVIIPVCIMMEDAKGNAWEEGGEYFSF